MPFDQLIRLALTSLPSSGRMKKKLQNERAINYMEVASFLQELGRKASFLHLWNFRPFASSAGRSLKALQLVIHLQANKSWKEGNIVGNTAAQSPFPLMLNLLYSIKL